jgi:hypothetical protein
MHANANGTTYADSIKAGDTFLYGFGAVTAAADARTIHLLGHVPSVQITCYKFGRSGPTFVAYFNANSTVEADPMARA